MSEGVLCPIHQTPMIFTHVADDDTEIYFCEACDALPRTAWNAITKAFEEDCWQEIIPVKPDTCGRCWVEILVNGRCPRCDAL